MRHALALLSLLLCTIPVEAPAAEVVTISEVQAAGMSQFRGHWNQPFVLAGDGPQTINDSVLTTRGGQAKWMAGTTGAIAFDALNRSVLLRFPSAAQVVAQRAAAGQALTKAELILPFRDEELWPVGNRDYIGADGYNYRTNWGIDSLYRGIRPQWHAIAQALRRPWQADPVKGPTYNANIAGRSFWTRFGAGDSGTDRHPSRFGPTEVSHVQTTGRMDLTGLFADSSYGTTLAQRLRTFSDCGVVVQKWETYDHRYFNGFYEYPTATGGRAILINSPRLELSFAAAPAQTISLPPAANLDAISGGAPTAALPDEAAIAFLATHFAQRPAGIPDWQWQHILDMRGAREARLLSAPFWEVFVPEWHYDRMATFRWENGVKVYTRRPTPAETYAAWIDVVIGRQVRGWDGFSTAREMSQWYRYRDALPGPAQDAFKRYWEAWIMPGRETAVESQQTSRTATDGKLVHPMVDDPRVNSGAAWLDPLNGISDSYWTLTKDWRGNKSFFRSGFCYRQSTQNFNTTASVGALLGGSMFMDAGAMADGRTGIDRWILRHWSWDNGTSQEHVDHYYFSISLSGNKALADFAQTPYDRMVGQSILAKNIEELATAWHPNLRTFIAGSSRSSLDFPLGSQDGIHHVMHVLSQRGAARDLGTKRLPGNILTYGKDVNPDLVAEQSLAGDWAPAWISDLVDNRTYPYRAQYTGWGGAKRTMAMGRNYGLASTAETGGSRFQMLGQWRRAEQIPQSMTELGTLDLRTGTNTTRWVNDTDGGVTQPGAIAIHQHGRKLIAISSPTNTPTAVSSFQTSVGLFNFQTGGPTWQIYVNGSPIGALPVTLNQGQRITIRDGATWIGLVPLPATDLGRSAQVLIEAGVPATPIHYDSNYGPAVVINSYNYRGSATTGSLTTDQQAAFARAYGGYVVEMADAGDFASFAAFQAHIAAATLNVAYNASTTEVAVTWTSGGETLEAASKTYNSGSATENGNPNLTRRLVNGVNPWLANGQRRVTGHSHEAVGPTTVQGNTFELLGSYRFYSPILLQTMPTTGLVCAWKPMPEPDSWRLQLSGGRSIASIGQAGLCRITVQPGTGGIDIDHAVSVGWNTPTPLTGFRLIGWATAPTVRVNGRTVPATADGANTWVVPYDDARPPIFTRQPVDHSAPAGQSANFRVEVAGWPAPSLRWQRKSAAGAWTDVPGADGRTLRWLPGSAEDGVNVRCIATSPAGSVTSSTAVFRVTTSVNGTLAFSSPTYTRTEGNSASGTATITVNRNNGSSGAVSVAYASANGTATAGTDYTATSGTLQWADGDVAAKTFTVTVAGDAAVEADETVLLNLSAPAGGAILGLASASLVITNDDVPPTTAVPVISSATGLGTGTPVLAGTSVPAATIRVYDGAALIATVSAGSDGSWTWTPSVPLGAGTHTITVTAQASGQGASGPSTAVVVTVPATGGGSGSSGGGGGGGGGCGLGAGLGLLLMGLVLALCRGRPLR